MKLVLLAIIQSTTSLHVIYDENKYLGKKIFFLPEVGT